MFPSYFQYYRDARMKALQAVYPDYVDENGLYFLQRNSLKYPRPLSAPPSPRSSRKKLYHSFYTNNLTVQSLTGHTTPAASVHGSDSEEDSVDEELELQELGLNDNH